MPTTTYDRLLDPTQPNYVGRAMSRLVALICLGVLTTPLAAAEQTLDQRLIVACYELDVEQVVQALRMSAGVNARFGDFAGEDPFLDRWTGSHFLPSDSWTPLLALAASRKLPRPSPELGNIWQDPVRAEAAQKAIPQAQIDERLKRQETILQILLSHRVNLEMDDGHGATAVSYSVDEEKIGMVKTLLKFGANPNPKTGIYFDGPGDTTPLHNAIHSRAMMQLLIDHGADGSAQDTNGQTPSDWLELIEDRQFDLVATPEGWRIRDRKHPGKK